MVCPECKSESEVVCSRKYEGTVIRRRMCKKCRYVFYTQELETTPLIWQIADGKYKNKILSNRR